MGYYYVKHVRKNFSNILISLLLSEHEVGDSTVLKFLTIIVISLILSGNEVGESVMLRMLGKMFNNYGYF